MGPSIRPEATARQMTRGHRAPAAWILQELAAGFEQRATSASADRLVQRRHGERVGGELLFVGAPLGEVG